MSLICPKCSNENKDKAVFCSNCGETLDKDKDYKRYDSIGGWLIVLVIGMVFLPLRILATIGEVSQNLKYEKLISLYPSMGEYLSNALTINYILLTMSFFLVYFFFTKKSYFPKIFIGWLILNIIVLLVDASMANSLAIDNSELQDILRAESIKNILSGLFVSAIWIPYMLISKRVKGTFTK